MFAAYVIAAMLVTLAMGGVLYNAAAWWRSRTQPGAGSSPVFLVPQLFLVTAWLLLWQTGAALSWMAYSALAIAFADVGLWVLLRVAFDALCKRS